MTDYSVEGVDKSIVDAWLRAVPKGSNVIDLGCGTGRFTNYLNEQGYNCSGIDISPKMISKAKKTYPNIDFRIMDMLDLQTDIKYNGILVLYSFFNMTKNNARHVLNKISNSLIENGKACFILHEGKGEGYLSDPINTREDMIKKGIKLEQYVARYLKEEICQMMQDVGLNVCYYEPFIDPDPEALWRESMVVFAAKHGKCDACSNEYSGLANVATNGR